MKSYFIYFVVDPIMESVVGSFTAPSNEAAKAVFQKSIVDNEKFKSYGQSLKLFREIDPYCTCETFSEIKEECSELVNIYE